MKWVRRSTVWAVMLFAGVLQWAGLGGWPAEVLVENKPRHEQGRPTALPSPTDYANDFEFTDLDGRKHLLAEVTSEGPAVFVFLGTECPLAKQYARPVQTLAEQFPSVPSFAVFSNSQDSPEEVIQFADSHQLTIPIVLDDQQRLADLLGAERTPEAFVVTEGHKVRYRGRIDDQFGIGFAKRKPESRDLANAIDDLLAGRDVRVSKTQAVGCIIGRRQSPSAATVTLAEHIAPILNRHCVQCHRAGEIGPFAMTDPDEIGGWAEMILEVVQEARMPPWHASPEVGAFRNARGLDVREKDLIAEWVRAGAPIGDLKQWPAPPRHVEGWQLAQPPDLILPVSPQPFRVPAQGEMEYQYFESDHVFEQDTWIRGVQLLPSNHRVVHHILAFISGQGESEAIGQLEGIDGYLAGYVPGLVAMPFPDGMAKKISRGSRLIFQVHYTPVGTEQHDHSHIGMLLADPDQVEREVVTTSALRRQLEIPPNESDHRVSAFSHRRLDGALLLGMMPHMHLRGKSFYYELQRADGTVEPLLDVPAYDFNWQTSYQLSQPISLRAGDRICCLAAFDNSEANPFNPNPAISVRWGDQTREEMMIGYFDIAVPRESDPTRSALDLKSHVARVRLLDRFDVNIDGRIDEHEVTRGLQQRFQSLDRNGDRQVTFAELAQGWQE